MAMNGELLITAKLRDAKKRRYRNNDARDRLAIQAASEFLVTFGGVRSLRFWKRTPKKGDARLRLLEQAANHVAGTNDKLLRAAVATLQMHAVL